MRAVAALPTGFVAAALLAVTTVVAAPAAVDESAVAEAVSHYDGGRHAQALALFLPAAEAGSLSAQYHLGLMHARGEGVPRDLSAAAGWFERAARGGHNHAQFILGHMYSRGDGVSRDLSRAHMWFTAAAANGWWKAREAREKLVADSMTPDEINEGMRLYQEFRREQKP